MIDGIKSNEQRLDILKKDGKLYLTDSQKEAVLADGRVIVSASAGSGKTSTMVKRILLMVCEGVPLKKILVLVYNTAAADELRERLHSGLFELACTAGKELRDRLRKQIDELPFCKICTIHAFCSSLIRDNFEKLGLSPSFEVLDEQAHAVYMNKALDNVFEEYSQNRDGVFDNIAEIFSKARREDNLRTNLIKLRQIIDIQPDRQAFLKRVDACFDSYGDSEFIACLQDYYKYFFSNALDKLNRNREELEATSVDKYKEAAKAISAFLEELLKAKSFEDMCSLAALYEKPSFGVRSRKLDDAEKRISSVTKAYADEIGKYISELVYVKEQTESFKIGHVQNRVFINKIVEITLRFDEELQKLKEKDNVLSFEDLQRLAGHLLDEYPTAGEEYDAVYVDEYQDVNPTQEAIIEHLVRDECFMVGDVKQSIYGFRLADPAIFLSRKYKYENGGGTAIGFNVNFRSAKEILSFVNGVFGTVMTVNSAQVDYDSDGSFDLQNAPAVGNVEIHLFTDKKSETKIARGLYDITAHEGDLDEIKASQYEGRFIAREIKSLVGRALTDGRAMRYGDIAILLRGRTRGARMIIEQLKAEGIPVEDGAFSKSGGRPEREIINLLRVIDNPRQDIPLAGFLLSCMGGLNEEELALISSAEGDCLYDKVRAYALLQNSLADKLKSALSIIYTYRIKSSFKNVAELMGGIVSDFSYDAYLMKSGEADVYALRAFIANVAGQEPKSLGRFLEDYCDGAEASNHSGGGDRVHISTFHGYKGLEIPVAFVADCACDFNFDLSADMSALGSGYIGLRRFDFKNKHKFETLSKFAVSKLNRMQQVREEMRLFYVALTRAKQYLYVTASVSKAERDRFGEQSKLGLATCDLDFVSAAICEGRTDVFCQIHLPEDSCEPVKRDEHLTLACDDGLVNKIKENRKLSYAYEESTRLAMKYSVSALDRDDQAVRVFEESANIGTLYHKVMQYIDFGVTGEEGVRSELARMRSENILTDEEIGAIDPAVIADCLSSGIMSYAREAELNGRCMRETPFMMYKPANELKEDFCTDDRVLVQGVIDLFINGDKKILVDFKYSVLNDKKLAEKYKTQLYLYKTAIESAICAKIDKVIIYSFLSRSAIEMDFNR